MPYVIPLKRASPKISQFEDFFEILHAVPRRHPLPDIDREICRRLKAWRLELRLTQQTIGDLLGVHANYIAHLENERGALRYWHAFILINTGFLNIHWLAKGEGLMLLKTPVQSAKTLHISPRSKLSEAYPKISSSIDSQDEAQLPRHLLRPYLDALAIEWSPKIPSGRVNELLDMIEKAAGVFFAIHRPDLPKTVETRKRIVPAFAALSLAALAAQSAQNKPLTNVLHAVTLDPLSMRVPTLENLIAQLRTATTERGAKARLARDLNVPLPRVSEWLSGVHEPDASNTLELLRWVEKQKEQKTPASVITTGKGNQTQKESTQNEPSKSGPLKRK